MNTLVLHSIGRGLPDVVCEGGGVSTLVLHSTGRVPNVGVRDFPQGNLFSRVGCRWVDRELTKQRA